MSAYIISYACTPTLNIDTDDVKYTAITTNHNGKRQVDECS